LVVLAAWFGGVGLVTLLAEPTPAVAVFAPGESALRVAVASDVDLVDSGRGYMLVRSNRRGFVRDLYANGAWFVWPAVEGGCSSSSPRAMRLRGKAAPRFGGV